MNKIQVIFRLSKWRSILIGLRHPSSWCTTLEISQIEASYQPYPNETPTKKPVLVEYQHLPKHSPITRQKLCCCVVLHSYFSVLPVEFLSRWLLDMIPSFIMKRLNPWFTGLSERPIWKCQKLDLAERLLVIIEQY